MNTLICIGLLLGAVVSFIDRLIHKIPSKLAVVLYLIAVVLVLVGVYHTRTAATGV